MSTFKEKLNSLVKGGQIKRIEKFKQTLEDRARLGMTSFTMAHELWLVEHEQFCETHNLNIYYYDSKSGKNLVEISW